MDLGQGIDFVMLFPHELCDKLFSYLSDQDLLVCSSCSRTWRNVINDNQVQWKRRYLRRGWDVRGRDLELEVLKSHVDPTEKFRFRKSPVFNVSNSTDLNISPLCGWALSFRQVLHSEHNWSKGIYSIKQLSEPDKSSKVCDAIGPTTPLNTAFDCDGKLLVYGNSFGDIHLWNVDGLPDFVASCCSRSRIEVQALILTGARLAAMYDNGLVKVFSKEKLTIPAMTWDSALVYAVKATGDYNSQEGVMNFHGECVLDYADEADSTNYEQEDDDPVAWIRDLFRTAFWMGFDASKTDLLIYANSTILVLTGILSRHLLWWNVEDIVPVINQVTLPTGFCVIDQSFLSSGKLFLSTRTRGLVQNGAMEASCILVYNVQELLQGGSNPIRIETPSVIKEIRSTDEDSKIAFVTDDGTVHGGQLKDDVFQLIFSIRRSAYVDNLVITDSFLVYHKFDGYLVGVDWSGNILYEFQSHIGLMRNMKVSNGRIISAGDAKELCVWDATTGSILHKVYRQPCRIHFLYADTTQIITVGRDDPPVVVAYW